MSCLKSTHMKIFYETKHIKISLYNAITNNVFKISANFLWQLINIYPALSGDKPFWVCLSECLLQCWRKHGHSGTVYWCRTIIVLTTDQSITVDQLNIVWIIKQLYHSNYTSHQSWECRTDRECTKWTRQLGYQKCFCSHLVTKLSTNLPQQA